MTLIAGTAVVVLIFGGVLMAAGTAGVAWSNTEKFCISCHEMKDQPYAEFKGTVHDANRSGVRASCSDCHVPRELGPMLIRKAYATYELYGWMIGKIDTPEKFEAHRYAMAKRVWINMKETDSLECRNCHQREAMSTEKQTEKAQAQHAKGDKEGLTCIDCHFGIAHKEPDGPGPQELKVSKRK